MTRECFMQFELHGTDKPKDEGGSFARRGTITFPRGKVETPAFMPVGTYGSCLLYTSDAADDP